MVAAVAVLVLSLLFAAVAVADEQRLYTSWAVPTSPWAVAFDRHGDVHVARLGADASLDRYAVVDDPATDGQRGFQLTSRFPLTGNTAGWRDVAVDDQGDIYVANIYDDQITRYSQDGAIKTTWGTPGTADGQFSSLCSLAIGPGGDVYALDFDGNRVQRFTPGGTFVSSFPVGSSTLTCGLDVGPDGRIFVVDSLDDVVRVYAPDGSPLQTIGGGGPGVLSSPRDVEVGGDGMVYVTDTVGGPVRVFRADGTHAHDLGVLGSQGDEIQAPVALAADRAGNVAVADAIRSRISLFAYAPRVVGGLERDFGSVHLDGSSPTQLIQLQNANYLLPMWVEAAGLDSGTDFSMPAANLECSSVILMPGAICSVGVRFAPTAAGTRSDLLSLDGGWREVGLSGTGTSAGAQGPVGPQGPTGPEGPQGSAGPEGPVGPAGPTGETGPAAPHDGSQAPARAAASQAPRVTRLRSGPIKLRVGRRIDFVTLSCPGLRACEVQGRWAVVSVRGRNTRLTVLGPRRIAAGRSARFGVRAPARLNSLLTADHRTGRMVVYLRATADGRNRTERYSHFVVTR